MADSTSLEVVLMRINQLVREIKVCGPYEVALLNWTPIFEWYMAKSESKNEHQKDVLQRDWRSAQYR